jgi:TolA-binding protein
MSRQYEFEDLEDYLSGRMSTADAETFESALGDDQELAARLEALRAERQLDKLLRRQYILDQLRELDAEEDRTKGGGNTKFNFRRLLPYSVAASLAGLVAAGIFMFSDQENSTVAAPAVRPGPAETEADTPVATPTVPDRQRVEDGRQYDEIARFAFREDNFELRLMGERRNDSTAGVCQKAADQYRKGNYAAARSILDAPGTDSLTECRYLRGYVLYKLGKYQSAEREFRTFRSLEFSDRKFDALWGEVFCMTRQLPASRERLLQLLHSMKTETDHPYGEQAVLLLKMMGEK